MLDIRFIRENKELVKRSAALKGINVDIEELLSLHTKHGEALRQVEELRAAKNRFADQHKQGNPDPISIEKGREIKVKLNEKEKELKSTEQWQEIIRDVPNIIPDDTPQGGEEANHEERKWGDTTDKSFEVMDHLTWGERNSTIDFERGAKVAGNKFYYLKGSLVDLELAIFQFGLEISKKHGFVPMAVPHLVHEWVAKGTGFLPRGEERQTYKIDEHNLHLIATAEIPLTGYHADEILDESELPKLYAGLSPAYRREAGAYGKHSRGLFRTHQFNKLELYVFCKGDLVESEEWHKKMVAIEEELCQELQIPYRVVRIAAGDLGAPAYKKYDVEYWSPVDKAYRELMSCSNVTDYQAQRLNIRYKKSNGDNEYVHTLNGTAAATSRMPIAIIENHQLEGGKVSIPQVLRPYMGGQLTI